MSTQAQILANQANSRHSTGPKSEAGKAVSSKNNLRHGLTGGPFVVFGWENQEEFGALKDELFAEHQPTTLTERMPVEDMAQSHWLRTRAIALQNMCFSRDLPADQPKELALYLRYQITHDRAFYKALNELQKLRAQKRRAENGFVSQERKAADEERRKLNDQRKEAHEKRRENEELRRQEMHNARVWLAEAQARRHETETSIAELTRLPQSDVAQAA